jgi:hypothetical protein
VFLAAFLEKASIPATIKAAKIMMALHHEWLVRDARYRERVEYAYTDVADGLRNEVTRLVMGWEEPVFYRNRRCGIRPRYSNRMRVFLPSAVNPKRRDLTATVSYLKARG